MATASASSSRVSDRQWYIVGRWQEFGGEGEANLLRLGGIAAFYIVELINYYGLNLGLIQMPRIRDRPFHLTVTALAVAWTMVGLGVQLCLRRQVFPSVLKFISTGCDLVLLTALLTVAGGPRSPMIAVFFLIIAMATLRFSRSLVWFATAGALAGYLVVLGYAAWFTTRNLRVPRYHELIVVLSITLTGLTLAQVIRRVRSLAQEYVDRLAGQARRSD